MGHFYSQVLVCGANQTDCAAVMRALGRRSFVAPPHRSIVPVCDAGSESLDIDELDSVAYTLSHRLKTPSVAVLNHDDDLLVFRIFGREGFKGYCRSGMLIGGAYTQLRYACEAMCSTASLWLTFARSFRFEYERHEALVRLLNLPPWSIGMGYRYLSQGDLPREMGEEELVRT